MVNDAYNFERRGWGNCPGVFHHQQRAMKDTEGIYVAIDPGAVAKQIALEVGKGLDQIVSTLAQSQGAELPITAEVLAERTGLKVAHIHDLRRKGKIRSYKLGGKVLFYFSEFNSDVRKNPCQ